MRCAFASRSGRGVIAAFLAVHGLLAGVASVAGEPPKAARQPRATRPRYGRALGGLSTEPETPVDKLPARYHGALGEIFRMHKQWSKAQEAFKEAYRKKSAERAEARRASIEARKRNDEPEEQAHAAKEKQYAAQCAQYAYRLAQLLLREGKNSEALPLLKEAVDNAPAKARGLELRVRRQTLASLFVKLDQNDKAAELYQRVLQSSADEQERIGAGRAIVKLCERGFGQPKQTEALLRQWFERSSGKEHEAARRHLIDLWKLAGTLDAATQQLEATVEKDGKNKDALVTLWRIYTSVKPNEARQLAIAEKLAKADPDDRSAAHVLLQTYERLKKYDQAIAQVKKLMVKHPADRWYLSRKLTSIYIAAGRKDAALEHARGLLQQRPKNEQLYDEVAGVYVRVGKPNDAIELYKEAATKAKSEAERDRYRLKSAGVALNAGRHDYAAPILRELSEKSKDRWVVGRARLLLDRLGQKQHAPLLRSAMAAQRDGKYDEAATILRTILKKVKAGAMAEQVERLLEHVYLARDNEWLEDAKKAMRRQDYDEAKEFVDRLMRRGKTSRILRQAEILHKKLEPDQGRAGQPKTPPAKP